jgi:hypothetical protein
MSNKFNELDLNIENYDLLDILNLFNIKSYDFDRDDLKQAKKIVLMTHPDKSRLDKKYFLFFKEAYKILYSIYEFRYKSSNENKDKTYQDLTTNSLEHKERSELLKNVNNKHKNAPEFNEWFNKMFDKTNISNKQKENGYGNWLSSNDDIDTRETTYSNMNQTFETKKREMKSIIVYKDYSTITYGENSIYKLDEEIDCPSTYSSDIFSKLKYDDLKRAHTETVIPVTIEDYNNKKKYNNINELNRDRQIKYDDMPTIQQSNEYLNNTKQNELKGDIERAFKLAKQDEYYKKINNTWWSKLKQIGI